MRIPTLALATSLLAGSLLIGSTSVATAVDAGEVVACTGNGILTQGEDVIEVDLVTGASTRVGTLGVQVNAAGYNLLDGYLYAWASDASGVKGIARIDGDWNLEVLGIPGGDGLEFRRNREHWRC